MGPAVVMGSQIVHTNGVNLTLDPALLAIALFGVAALVGLVQDAVTLA